MFTLKDIAKRNYGRTWTLEQLKTLVRKGKLSTEDFEEITGETYDDTLDSK